jgi:hypothetical protein
MNPLDLRSMAVVLAVLVAGGPVWAASLDQRTTRALVAIRIYNSFGVPAEDLVAARTEADSILRRAGLEPVWIHCPVIEARRISGARCDAELEPGELVVRILGSSHLDTASSDRPLGEALVHSQFHTGSFATVFADRVANTADRAGADSRGVLGRVIAHEIGHLLLGTRHHAVHGLMRGNWTDKELRRPIGLEWHFSPSEARRMRARCASSRPSEVEPN